MPLLRLLCLLIFIALPAALAQDEEPPEKPVNGSKNLERLQTLMPALQVAENDLAALEARLADAATETEKSAIGQEVTEQRERVTKLRENFLTIATGVEEARYLRREGEAAGWEQNLEDIIAPISREVREMTAEAREMEQLRIDFEDWSERRDMATRATDRLARLLENAEKPAIRSELEKALRLWKNRLAEAASQTEVLRQTMDERAADERSTWEVVSEALAEFWRSRGLNLVLALVLGVVVFFAARRSYRLLRRISPLHRKGGHNLAARIVDLLWAGVAALLGFGAAVLVLYLRGDWLLLALAIVMILGLLWTSKNALQPYLEQIRLILNLGPVRQGERLLHNGLPWRVDRLHFYCEFRNPALSDTLLRLPVRDVLPLHSRPLTPKEQWFPTQTDDWVKLDDGTFGKVIQQSSEQVVVLRLGGSLKTYPTSDFLGQCPENLSRGFRISATFGIDYEHQEISTTRVPEILQFKIEKVLLERVTRDHLRSVKVEFASAGASSLDYAVLADFDGEVAARLNVLERLIHKTCVDVCNKEGWTIPFTQITLHQAAAPPAQDAGEEEEAPRRSKLPA